VVGSTSKIVVHIRGSFAHGFTYVMLSIVTNCANLMIQDNLKPPDFICIHQ
jgi:hypothetical protein